MSKIEELVRALADEIAGQVLNKIQKPTVVPALEDLGIDYGAEVEALAKEEKKIAKKKGRPRKTVIEPVEQLENEPSQEKQLFSIQHNTPNAKVVARNVPFDKTTVKNTFNDNINDFSDQLVTNNKKLGVANPRPRHQRDDGDTGAKVAVECFICGKKENVVPILANGYSPRKDENVYKCNECNTPKGRMKIR